MDKKERSECLQEIMFYTILVILILAIIGFGVYCIRHKVSLEPIGVILTFLTLRAGSLMDYRWGSSVGSKDKDKQLANTTPIPPPQTSTTTINNAAEETETK